MSNAFMASAEKSKREQEKIRTSVAMYDYDQ